VELYLAALDAAGMPDEAPFRTAVREHVEFGSHVAMQNSNDDGRRAAPTPDGPALDVARRALRPPHRAYIELGPDHSTHALAHEGRPRSTSSPSLSGGSQPPLVEFVAADDFTHASGGGAKRVAKFARAHPVGSRM
jgi:hypothetical protein